jgi:prolyl 4-hydroxylase
MTIAEDILGFAVNRNRAVETAQSIKRKLNKSSHVSNLSQMGLDIYAVPNFADPEFCNDLFMLIEADSDHSQLLDAPEYDNDPDFRTSNTCHFSKNNSLIALLDNEICELIGIDPRKGESTQGQRYRIGQKFKPHYDVCSHQSVHWPEWRANGGQRIWTAMLYLNEPQMGGETNFPHAMLTVKPQTGMLLLWNNLDSDAFVNRAAFHQGCEVKLGAKYIVTKWFRENFVK